MRFLFTFAGGTGHFFPTVPFARALAQRGHTIAYACQDAMVPVVRSGGWETVASGGSTLLDPRQRRPLPPLDFAAEKEVIRDVFAGRVARERARRLRSVVRTLQPDVIVRDETDFGAAVAAEASGLPHAAVVVIAAGGFLLPELIEEPLAALRADYGLPGDGLAMLHRYLTLVPVAPRFRDPLDPLPGTAQHVRPAVLDRARRTPVTSAPSRGRATVYFTLGTVFHQESGDLFTRVLSALSPLPVEIVVSVGHEIDPAELGPQPHNVRVERFVDAAEMLSRAKLVVCHGGSGTVLGALAFGVPALLLPIGADQPLNASRCRELGVAIVLDAASASISEIAAAAQTVLENRSYRLNAEVLRDEMHLLASSEQAAVSLERLAHLSASR